MATRNAKDTKGLCHGRPGLMSYAGLLYGTGFGSSYYQRFNNVPDSGTDITVHLSGGGTGANVHVNDGYTVISQLIFTALLVAE